MRLFADSSFFIAYYDEDDQYHKRVVEIAKELAIQSPQIFTTDYIYDETLTFLLGTHHYYGFLRAQRFDHDVLGSGKFTYVYITGVIFNRAREIFLRFNKDKRWSFTDCASYAIMADYGIQRVLTFDKNFKEMGFTMVR